MENGEIRDKFRIPEIFVKVRKLPGRQQAFVNDAARRERGDVATLGQESFGALAKQGEAPLEFCRSIGGRSFRRSRLDEKLPDLRHRLKCSLAECVRIDRNLAPAGEGRAVMRRAHRLRRPADFQRVRAMRRSWGHPLLVLYVAPNDGQATRLGISVGKRVGKAVVRNQVKRRVREAVRNRYIDLLPGHDLVFCGPGDPGILGALPRPGVEYLPPRPQAELRALYHAADVLVLPAEVREGFPLVVQEAVACGLPVLVPDQRWARERFAERARYWPKKSHAAKVAALQKFYHDCPALPAPDVHLHSWIEVAERLRGVYARMLARPGGAR